MNEWTTDPAFRFRSKELRGPDPVGAKAMRTLRFMANCGSLPKHYASAQIERLRRSGYVVAVPGGDELFAPTEAGRALLARATEPKTLGDDAKVMAQRDVATAADTERGG